MISNNNGNNNDRFESDIDILIEEIMRRSKNQEQLQKEIDINQKKLEELSKTTRNMQLNEMFENEFKKYQQAKNNNNNNKSVTPLPTSTSNNNNNNKVKESLSPIAENQLEFIYSTIEKYDSNDDFHNIQKSESNFSLNELQELIKTATHTNENLDMEFIKNFFQSEISNCIKNSDNDKELQVSLNKMLQDFLICLQTNLAEIQKKQQQPLITNNSSNYRNKINNNNNNYQLIDPETDEKQVEVVFQNIYRSHALTHVCWGKYIFIFVSCFENFFLSLSFSGVLKLRIF